MSLGKYITDSVINLLKNSSKLVPTELKEQRLAICNGCENKGIVEPLPLMKCEGCTLCGCPLETITSIDKNFALGRALCKAGKWNEIDNQYLK